DWSSFLSAAARWKLPTENLVYADVEGNIGWIAAGLMPKRSWSGLLPVPGTGGYEWSGFRAVEELPRAFNPPSGYIVTANNDIRPPGYNVPLNFEFATPYRAVAGLGDSWIHEWPSPDAPLAMLTAAARDTVMLASMDTAMARMRERMGADSSRWRWGALHTAAFPHKVAAAFDLAPVGRGGDGSTVNSTAGTDYHQTHGASYREILDVADWDRSVATSVPGQSGQPGSEFYGNLLPLWARGEYFPL